MEEPAITRPPRFPSVAEMRQWSSAFDQERGSQKPKIYGEEDASSDRTEEASIIESRRNRNPIRRMHVTENTSRARATKRPNHRVRSKESQEDASVVSAWSKSSLVKPLFEFDTSSVMESISGVVSASTSLFRKSDDPWRAAKRGDLGALKQFHASGNVDWMKKDEFQNIPLYYACHSGAIANIMVVPFLLWVTPLKDSHELDKYSQNAIDQQVRTILSAYKKGGISAVAMGKNDEESIYSHEEKVDERLNEKKSFSARTAKTKGRTELLVNRHKDSITTSKATDYSKSRSGDDARNKAVVANDDWDRTMEQYSMPSSESKSRGDTSSVGSREGESSVQSKRSFKSMLSVGRNRNQKLPKGGSIPKQVNKPIENVVESEKNIRPQKGGESGSYLSRDRSSRQGGESGSYSSKNKSSRQRGKGAESIVDDDENSFQRAFAKTKRPVDTHTCNRALCRTRDDLPPRPSRPSSRNEFCIEDRNPETKEVNESQNFDEREDWDRPIEQIRRYGSIKAKGSMASVSGRDDDSWSIGSLLSLKKWRNNGKQLDGNKIDEILGMDQEGKPTDDGQSLSSWSTNARSFDSFSHRHIQQVSPGKGTVGTSRQFLKPYIEYHENECTWVIGNQWKSSSDGEENKMVHVSDNKQRVHVVNCHDVSIHIHGRKMKALLVDNCSNVNVIFDTIITTCEVVSCSSIGLQATGVCPMFAIESSKSIKIWLTGEGMNTSNFVTSKSSEVTISVPQTDDAHSSERKEVPLPVQYVHKFLDGGMMSHLPGLY